MRMEIVYRVQAAEVLLLIDASVALVLGMGEDLVSWSHPLLLDNCPLLLASLVRYSHLPLARCHL